MITKIKWRNPDIHKPEGEEVFIFTSHKPEWPIGYEIIGAEYEPDTDTYFNNDGIGMGGIRYESHEVQWWCYAEDLKNLVVE